MLMAYLLYLFQFISTKFYLYISIYFVHIYLFPFISIYFEWHILPTSDRRGSNMYWFTCVWSSLPSSNKCFLQSSSWILFQAKTQQKMTDWHNCVVCNCVSCFLFEKLWIKKTCYFECEHLYNVFGWFPDQGTDQISYVIHASVPMSVVKENWEFVGWKYHLCFISGKIDLENNPSKDPWSNMSPKSPTIKKSNCLKQGWSYHVCLSFFVACLVLESKSLLVLDIPS